MRVSPDFNEFRKLCRRGNLVALTASIPADLETPVSAYLKLAGQKDYAFLLESAEQEERIGRYSFIGFDPAEILLSRNGKNYKITGAKTVELAPGRHISTLMEDHLGLNRLANPESLPGFAGGFVGFFGYENVEYFEQVRLAPRKGPDFPDAVFFLTRDFVIFDHFRKTVSFVSLVKTGSGQPKALYEKAVRQLSAAVKRLRMPLRMPAPQNSPLVSKPVTNMSKSEFCKRVRRIKEYIRAGDGIQVVLSQRLRLPAVKNDFRIYRALRSINPSPYMFYFRAGRYRMIGTSPELLVKKTGSEAEVRPIAGTRPRGATPAEDGSQEEHLRKSVKENAEHLMLVDLGRNDLGRVCRFESVRVKNFARVERYSHVMHLVSDVVGRLKPEKNAFDLLKASFPAGTVTGAPKIRAMQIINELEPERRGPYAGCLGYFSYNQDMDMCITIRTLFTDGRSMYLQAGAGIVKDSIPEKEYEETMNKAKALLRALARQGEF